MPNVFPATGQTGDTAGLADGAPLPDGEWFVDLLPWADEFAQTGSDAPNVATPGDTGGIDDGAPLPDGDFFVDDLPWNEGSAVLLGDGDDERAGGSGRDVLYGQGGNDTLSGLGAADALMGGAGADELFGGRGSDFLFGGAGGDRIMGAKGDDTLIGGGGDDDLRGGAGDDHLFGGVGDDRLEGGKGSDVFAFAGRGGGVDRVLDFDPSKDVLDLRGFFSGGSETLADFVSQSGDDLRIEIYNAVIILNDTTFADLNDENVMFRPGLPTPPDTALI